ncbi:MAG: GAF domain-containing protein [Pseudonocardia sp.]|nr:GAF domain-containing protein [Pseudonocardia sp.]
MSIVVAPERSSVLPKAERSQGWRRREAELAARLATLRDMVGAALGATAIPDVIGGTHGRSAEVVAHFAESCINRLWRTPGQDTELIQRLCALVMDLQQLALDLSLHELSLRARRLADCSAGLNRLRALPSSSEVLGQVCEEVVWRCGFHRAVFSRVTSGTWRPWMASFRDDAEFASWFTDWVDRRIPLDRPTPEGRLLSERRSALVHDTEAVPVYRPIIVDAGRSRSYVVAPIVVNKEVLGFLHADHQLSRRADEADRDVLWAFAEGLGHIYERTVLLERLRAQRDQVRDLLFSAVDSMNELCESTIDLARQTDAAGLDGGCCRVHVPIDKLTAREAEVFELMAAGATNAAIAERLFITGDTVKSHVKHILRKLGAANRAQAIAWSLNEGVMTPPSG